MTRRWAWTQNAAHVRQHLWPLYYRSQLETKWGGGDYGQKERIRWKEKKLRAGLCEGSRGWRSIRRRERSTGIGNRASGWCSPAFIYAESRQVPKRIIQMINEFLAIFCEIRHHFNSFTFLLVQLLTDPFLPLCKELKMRASEAGIDSHQLDKYTHYTLPWPLHHRDYIAKISCFFLLTNRNSFLPRWKEIKMLIRQPTADPQHLDQRHSALKETKNT